MQLKSKRFSPFEASIEAAFRRLGAAGRSVLLAASGGADSTALVLATGRVREALRMRVEVASLDHGLRPAAAREVQAVAELAHQLGLAFHTEKLGLSPGSGLEERARAVRYAALEEIRRAAGLDLIATAHTATDQAETVLMRLARGASLRGASGVLASRGAVIRPMLGLTRGEVEAYLKERGVRPVRDPMNRDLSFLRVRVRRKVLPALEAAAGEGIARRLARFAQLAAEDEALFSKLADDAFSRLTLEPAVLDAVGLRSLEGPIRRRVLARLLEEAGIPVDADTLESAAAAVARGATATLPRDRLLRAEGQRVRVAPAPPRRGARAPSEWTSPLWVDGPFVIDPASGLELSASSSPLEGPFTARVSAEEPLLVRHRRPGDRVGTRKLQDLLIDLRIPAERRDAIPLVCDAEGRIVWAVGVWPNRNARARASGRPLFLRAAPAVGHPSARPGPSL